MDTYSSGEDFIIKTRKPYTITKQRERWTEEEHNRFLEALKLYGRAWQRIEEHIGTKTAVQIRSHAQKFFSKLEKEALVKGVSVGQTLEIDIPPPRPKRKPNNPYPRKTCAGLPISQVGIKDGKYFSSESSSDCKQVMEFEKEPLPKNTGGEGKPAHQKESQDNDCSEVLTQRQGSHSSPAYNSFRPKPPMGLGNIGSFREFVPSSKKANHDDANGSHITAETNSCRNAQKDDTCEMEIEENNNNTSQEGMYFGDTNTSCENVQKMDDEMQATQNYPRHVPVHVLDGSIGIHSADVSLQDPNFPPNLNLFASSAASGTTENHQTNPSGSSTHQSFQPFNPNPPRFAQIRHNHNQDDYQSFLHMSSAFPSLIVSTLLQNPAAHAAASFAATFWPYSNGKTPTESPRQMSSAPSMAAIAAATVAAATAWWALHGLLPMCAPVHGSPFTCTDNPPPAIGGAPLPDSGQAPAAKTDGDKSLDPRPSDQHSDSKSSSSDTEPTGVEKTNATDSKATADQVNVEETPDLQDSNKENKGRKQVDRSSCGSNTASSSDIETDALEKKDIAEEEIKESDNNNPVSDSNIRRSRSNSTSTDSWKEVSEEGRLAFQALFSRQVLPQSFSPPPDQKDNAENQNGSPSEGKQNEEERGVTSLLDLNIRACSQIEPEKNVAPNLDNNSDEGLLTIGLGPGKIKARRTGFKPYKRCSVEAKESCVALSPGGQVEEQGNKRLRLEGDVQFNI